MMVRACKLLMELQHIYMEPMLLNYLKYIKMINFAYYTNENRTEHNQKWPNILEHP